MSKTIKKVVVFGATGQTGLPTVQCAIDRGYDVTVLLRDPMKLPSSVTPTHVVVGDVTNASDVEKAVRGQDAVIAVLGTGVDFGPTTVLSVGTQNIINAMKAENIQRISCCISGFLFFGDCLDRYKGLHEDHKRQLQVLKSSDRQWVAVCPPHIQDIPARGNYILKNDGPVTDGISKYDLADILVKCLSDEDRIGHLVGMGY